jgi:putative DNA primase/helicase
MIDGCLSWQRDGLNPPDIVRTATTAYLEAEDAIATWIDECCTLDPNVWDKSSNLFASWGGWARRAGETIGSQKAFSQALENRPGIHPKRASNGGRGFNGIRVNPTMFESGE